MSRTIRRMPLALITTILTVLLLFSCLLGLKLGYLSVFLSGIVSILASHLLGSALPSDIAMGIADAVWDLRLPRILLALAVGMGLSLSGMVMQAMYLSAVPLSPQRTGALAVSVIRNPSLDKKSTFCAF